MKILAAYDEKHGAHHISLDKIYLLKSNLKQYSMIENAIEFLLRKEGIFQILPSICTSILAKNHPILVASIKAVVKVLFTSKFIYEKHAVKTNQSAKSAQKSVTKATQ